LKQYQDFIHLSKYARWKEKEKRRETWKETVDRYGKFLYNKLPLNREGYVDKSFNDSFNEAIKSKRSQEVMGSMRTLWTAGKALDRDNVAGYNCAAVAVTHPRVFDEIFYLLMCGAGVGYSVERQYINKLPEISEEFYETETVISVRDSKIGWATALRELISLLYSGQVPRWDVSKVRPSGARLKTFGGRASGPAPLEGLFRQFSYTFKQARGRRLNSLEVFDLVCYIADTVIVGSVRRSACICLSNLTDDRMRRAKTGEWYLKNNQRALANISTAFTEKPDLDAFSKEFRSMHKSRAGERGIINKEALREKAEQSRRDYKGDYLLNPCGEAILRDSGGLCNLTEVIVRSTDTLESLREKVRYATILGTLQSTLTGFRYLRKVWKDNAEEERLLGISLTGIMDHEVMSGNASPYYGTSGRPLLEEWLVELKEVAVETNKMWAEKLGINPSKQLGLIKPSGTVSQLVNCSAGIHPRMFPFYIRNIRMDIKDPLSSLMIDEGVPYVEYSGKYIFQFPIKSPEGSITSHDVNAISQLNLWKVYRDHWCDGNPSQTIYYTEDEFFAVADWVWKNWDSVGGLSFFPKDDNIYDYPPYQEVSEEAYEGLRDAFPKEIDWSKLGTYETNDNTTGAQEVACGGAGCEI
jgi:ribonucleoside-diphosphate reductase alpha chain